MKKKLIVFFFVTILLLCVCGCSYDNASKTVSEGLQEEVVETPLEEPENTAEPEETAEPESADMPEKTAETHLEEPGNTAEPEETAEPESTDMPKEEYPSELFCVRLADDYDEDGFAVEIKDAVWVNADDEELIKEYGLEDAYFDNDYEIVFPYDEWIRVCAFKDGNSEFSVIDWEAEIPALSKKSIDADEFIALLKDRGEILAEIELYKACIVSIEEIYIP